MSIEYTYPSQYPRFGQAVVQGAAPAAAQQASGTEAALFGKDGVGFKDFLDVINPLQQLPVIGTIYRALTGDTISNASRMAGGFLLGGPIGLALAAADSGLEMATGKDAGGTLVAMVSGAPQETQMAAAAYRKAGALS